MLESERVLLDCFRVSHCYLDIIGRKYYCDVAEPIFLCKFTIVALEMRAIIVPHNLWNALLTEYLLC